MDYLSTFYPELQSSRIFTNPRDHLKNIKITHEKHSFNTLSFVLNEIDDNPIHCMEDALIFLLSFLQINVTGGQISKTEYSQLNSTYYSNNTINLSTLLVDGEMLSEHVKCLDLLFYAINYCRSISDSSFINWWIYVQALWTLQTVCVKSSNQSASTIAGGAPVLSIQDYLLSCGVKVYPELSSFFRPINSLSLDNPFETKQHIIMETQYVNIFLIFYSNIFTFYDLHKVSSCDTLLESLPSIYSEICHQNSIIFKITSEMGIRRKYQTQEFAQFVLKYYVKTTSENIHSENQKEHITENNNQKDLLENNNNHKDMNNTDDNMRGLIVSLDELDPDNDILESVQKLTKSEEDKLDGYILKEDFSDFDLLLLSSYNNYLFSQIPIGDELILNAINAISSLIIENYSKKQSEINNPIERRHYTHSYEWINFSFFLYSRSICEYHRIKTKHRSCFQLQAMEEDLFTSTSNTHAPYLSPISPYPHIIRLRIEYGRRMCQCGMVMSAFDMFWELEYFDDAIDCLLVGNQTSRALNIIQNELPPNLHRLCVLGDLTDRIGPYIDSLKLSNNNYARGHRSIAFYFWNRYFIGDKIKLVRSTHLAKFQKIAGNIILHYSELSTNIAPLVSRVWFLMGTVCLRLSEMEDLEITDEDVLNFTNESTDEYLEIFNNIDILSLNIDYLSLAYTSFSRVVLIDDNDFNSWGNLANISIQRKDWSNAKNSLNEGIRRSPQNQRLWQNFFYVATENRDLYSVLSAGKFFLSKNLLVEMKWFNFLHSVISELDGNILSKYIEFFENEILVKIMGDGFVNYCYLLLLNKENDNFLKIYQKALMTLKYVEEDFPFLNEIFKIIKNSLEKLMSINYSSENLKLSGLKLMLSRKEYLRFTECCEILDLITV